MSSLIARNVKWVTPFVLFLTCLQAGLAAAETNKVHAVMTAAETQGEGTNKIAALSTVNHVNHDEAATPAAPTNAVHMQPETQKAREHKPAMSPSPSLPNATTPPAMPEYHRYKPSREYAWHDDLSAKTRDGYEKMHELLGDHLHVGISSTSYDFKENLSRVGQGAENYFIGTIDELQDVQDESWNNLTFGIYLSRNFGLEYRYDEVRVKTFTDSGNNHSDGDFVVEGKVISAVARLPLDQVLSGMHYVFDWPYEDKGWAYNFLARFVPYVGIGFDSLAGSFDAATWWAHGYASPASWESLGSPPDTIRNNHVRELRVTDDIGRYELYGIAVRILDNLYFDVNWASVEADIAVDFYLDRQYQSSGVIPMSYDSKSIGVRYFF